MYLLTFISLVYYLEKLLLPLFSFVLQTLNSFFSNITALATVEVESWIFLTELLLKSRN